MGYIAFCAFKMVEFELWQWWEQEVSLPLAVETNLVCSRTERALKARPWANEGLLVTTNKTEWEKGHAQKMDTKKA